MSRGKRRVTARLPVDLVERIDARVEAWRSALPGMRVTRTDLIAILLEVGLRHSEAEVPGLAALIGKSQGDSPWPT